ncbi:MAG: aminoacyl-tRNA hydrolase [Porphyromonadaceae bacterium]|nr:aminoacyl-tRNA hydrolase [Porphyromonadaceae bacterium]
MKYLIVGLGNIGQEYNGTRHNIGFTMVNALAEEGKVSFEEKRYGAVAQMRMKNAELILLKPNTYMNLSGNAVRYWAQQENIPIERILILVDDVALPFGKLRLKAKGSDAGHNGLKNIAQMLSTQSYARLRFGLGNDYPQGGQIDFVLGHFSSEEERQITEILPQVVEIVRSFCLEGVQRAMNKYN